jgi:chorismate synthase
LAGNTFGKEFAITCFGESHGKCVGVVIDGCPAGLPVEESEVQKELDKRIPKGSGIVSARLEEDKVEILSGVFEGFTTGAPICMLVWNKQVDSSAYEEIKDKPRPGHADFPARIRYGGFNDYRGGGRFSGRITVALIMAGSIAKNLLNKINVEVLAHVVEIGGIKIPKPVSVDEIRKHVYENPVRCADPEYARLMEEKILEAARNGDSVGGVVEGMALNVPAGVGEPIFDSIDSDIADILFNIPAVKGVEFGAGFQAARLKGSENNDQYAKVNDRIVTTTNNAGGVLGGLSTGMPIVTRVAVKPTPSILRRQRTVDLKQMREVEIEVKGRHDPCVVPKAVPAVESAISIVLADHFIRLGLIPKTFRRR